MIRFLEIKFRAFSDGKMINQDQTIMTENIDQLCYFFKIIRKDAIIMQFTGLRDRKSKEIYEGDILKIGEDLIEVVEWVSESNWMGDKCPINGFINHESIYKNKPEIIGNIFENANLLQDFSQSIT